MSSSATSVRPYISIRARAPSHIASSSVSLSDASTSEDDLHFSTRTPSPSSDPCPDHATMGHSFFTTLSSFMPVKSGRRIYSLPASESSSIDSLSLPLPASPQQASFGADVWQQDGHYRTGGLPTTQETRPWWSGGVSAFIPLFLVIIIFALSTLLVVVALLSLPVTLSFPRTLSELSELGRELQAYAESGIRPMAHVLGVLSVTALWKHAWSVPGSVLLNVLAGVLVSPAAATLLMTFLTALGSILASLLATPLAPIIAQITPKALSLTRNAIEGGDTLSSKDKSPVWIRLSVLRLIGVVPWSGINVACGVTGVSLFDCLLGAFIGTLPWTAVTCQIGDLMQTVVSSTSSADPETLTSLLHSPTVILKLVALTFVSLVPILARDWLKGLISRSSEQETVTKEGVTKNTNGRRRWFKQWRTRTVTAVEMTVQNEKLATTSRS